jgi:hypothetical protein
LDIIIENKKIGRVNLVEETAPWDIRRLQDYDFQEVLSFGLLIVLEIA